MKAKTLDEKLKDMKFSRLSAEKRKNIIYYANTYAATYDDTLCMEAYSGAAHSKLPVNTRFLLVDYIGESDIRARAIIDTPALSGNQRVKLAMRTVDKFEFHDDNNFGKYDREIRCLTKVALEADLNPRQIMAIINDLKARRKNAGWDDRYGYKAAKSILKIAVHSNIDLSDRVKVLEVEIPRVFGFRDMNEYQSKLKQYRREKAKDIFGISYDERFGMYGGILMSAAQHIPDLTPDQRFAYLKISNMRMRAVFSNELDSTLQAILDTPDLSVEQRLFFAMQLEDPFNRIRCGRKIVGITPKQTVELLRYGKRWNQEKIQHALRGQSDGFGVDYVNDYNYSKDSLNLSSSYRYELACKLTDDPHRMIALRTKGLTPQHRYKLALRMSTDKYRYKAAILTPHLKIEQRKQIIATIEDKTYRQKAKSELKKTI